MFQKIFIVLLVSSTWCLASGTLSVHAGNLQRDRLSQAYRNQMRVGATRFYQFCCQKSIDFDSIVLDPASANAALVAFVQAQFDDKCSLWVSKAAVLGIQTLYRELQGHLRPAWDSISSWKMQTPVLSRRPMQRVVLEALLSYTCAAAFCFDTVRLFEWLIFGITLRVGWWGLLRPGEIFKLRRKDMRWPTSKLHPNVLVVTILDPKNRNFMGRMQVVKIADPNTIAWVIWYMENLPDFWPLWPFSEKCFHKLLKTALRSMSAYIQEIEATLGLLTLAKESFNFDSIVLKVLAQVPVSVQSPWIYFLRSCLLLRRRWRRLYCSRSGS